MERATAAEIDQAAAAWAAKVDRGLTAAEEADLMAWQASDPRCMGAYARTRAVALHTQRAAALGDAYQPRKIPEGKQPMRLSRRRLLFAACAASVGAAGFGALSLFFFGGGQRYRTRKGEIRQIALADGTVITMNTDSELSVALTDARRDVRLIQGEALFSVAHDRRRPFYVSAGQTSIRVVGTSFSVTRINGMPVRVLVREGIVEVTQRVARAVEQFRLVANTKVLLPAVPALQSLAPASISVARVSESELDRDLAWREGRIALEGETLAQAAAEFARYSDIKIVVEDPTLAREEIAGLYQADDPVGFARAVAVSLNAQVAVSSGEVRIFR